MSLSKLSSKQNSISRLQARQAAILFRLYAKFLCSITKEFMFDPQVIDGIVCEKASWDMWLKEFENCSPDRIPSPVKAGQFLSTNKYQAHTELRNEALEFIAMVATLDSAVLHAETTCDVLAPEIFQEMDKLMKTDILKDMELKLPQVVVIGMEDQGKSSLLERLIGFCVFPKKSGLCTICPIRLELRRGDAKIPTVCVKYTDTRKVAHNSSEAVSLSNIYDVVCEKMDLVKSKMMPNEFFSETMYVEVSITMPYAPNLNMLDLPGINAANTSTNQSTDTLPAQNRAKASLKLATRIIEEENTYSIYLLAVQFGQNPSIHTTTELIKDMKLEERTIPVFTKLDLAEQSLRNKAVMNKSIKDLTESQYIAPKWFACSNILDYEAAVEEGGYEHPGSDYIEHLARAEREEKEQVLDKAFFQPLVNTGQVGMTVLRSEFTRCYNRFIVDVWMPSIIKALKPAVDKAFEDNMNLGKPIPRSDGDDVKDLIDEILVFEEVKPNHKELLALADDNEILALVYKRIRSILQSSDSVVDVKQMMLQEVLEEYQTKLQAIIPSAFAEVVLQSRTPNAFANDGKLTSMCAINGRNCMMTFVEQLEQVAKNRSFWENFIHELVKEPKRFKNSKNYTEISDIDALRISRFPMLAEQLIVSLEAAMVAASETFVREATDLVEVAFRDPLRAISSSFVKDTSGNSIRRRSWSTTVSELPDQLLAVWFATTVEVVVDRINLWRAAGGLEAESCLTDRVAALKKMRDTITVTHAFQDLQSKFSSAGGSAKALFGGFEESKSSKSSMQSSAAAKKK